MAQAQFTGHGANGRPISWLAVFIIVIGFTIGGVGLCMNPPIWWIFWAGCGITAAGVALGFACDMMADFTTEED
jgi:hypothetical protein